MAHLVVELLGNGTCRIEKQPAGLVIETDVPRDLGGPGNRFSSTELLAAALGSCIGSSLAPVASRLQLDPSRIRLTVERHLGSKPRRLESIDVVIHAGQDVPDNARRRLLAAARACPVHRSLDAGVSVTIGFSDAIRSPD